MSFSTWNFNSISVNEACRVARFKQEHDWYSLKFRDWTENGSTRFRVRSEETGTERNGTKRNGGRGRVGPGRCRARPGPGADRCPSNGCKSVGGSAAFSEELAELRPFRPIGSWWNIRVFRPRQPSGRRQHRHRPFHSIPHTHTQTSSNRRFIRHRMRICFLNPLLFLFPARSRFRWTRQLSFGILPSFLHVFDRFTGIYTEKAVLIQLAFIESLPVSKIRSSSSVALNEKRNEMFCPNDDVRSCGHF